MGHQTTMWHTGTGLGWEAECGGHAGGRMVPGCGLTAHATDYDDAISALARAHTGEPDPGWELQRAEAEAVSAMLGLPA